MGAGKRAKREARRRQLEMERKGKGVRVRRRWLVRGMLFVGLLVAFGLGQVIIASGSSDQQPELGREQSDEGRGHLSRGVMPYYANTPPTSGRHYPVVVPYGVYDVTVPEGIWVHNLEHGAIVVLYRCSAEAPPCATVIERLRELYERVPAGKYGKTKMVAIPYPRLRTPIAVLAWNRILDLPSIQSDAIITFYRRYVDKGPEDVP